MKRLFIIDYENHASLDFIDNLNLNTCDRVVLFYSKNQDKISIDRLIELRESGCHIDYIRAEVGIPNALDFQLVVYATEQMRRYKENYVYYIVSNDRGIQLGIKYYLRLVDSHVNVKFIQKGCSPKDIVFDKTIPKGKIVLKECNELDPLTRVNRLVSDLFVVGLTRNGIESMTKNDLHNYLVHKFGDKGKKHYDYIKRWIA